MWRIQDQISKDHYSMSTLLRLKSQEQHKRALSLEKRFKWQSDAYLDKQALSEEQFGSRYFGESAKGSLWVTDLTWLTLHPPEGRISLSMNIAMTTWPGN